MLTLQLPTIKHTQTTTTKASNNYTENDIEEFEKKFRSIGKITYKIRFYQMKTRVEINTNFYTYLLGYKIVPEDGAWTYYIGEKESFSEAKQQLLQLRSKGVKNLKIIPFVNGKKIDWVFNV